MFDRGAWLPLIALVLLLVALFMPRVNLPHDTYEYIVVFDITQSMDVQDYEIGAAPISRLQYAKQAVRHAIRTLPCGSRIGWGAFAEYRSLLLLAPVEVCANYNDLLASLDNIDGRMRWANASEVGKGVYWAARAALESGSKPNVLFVSDGQEAPPILPGETFIMPGDLQPGQVRGVIIGTGGDTPQPIPHTDAEGRRLGFWRANEVIQLLSQDGKKVISTEQLSALRETHLQEVAKRVGFGYTRLRDMDSMSTVMRDPQFVKRSPAPVDLYGLPVAAAIVLLALRFRPVFKTRQ